MNYPFASISDCWSWDRFDHWFAANIIWTRSFFVFIIIIVFVVRFIIIVNIIIVVIVNLLWYRNVFDATNTWTAKISVYNQYAAIDVIGSCLKQRLQCNNFPTTPDLITLFDEEMNKGSSDMCQYSELFPYNNVITQALLNCNEVGSLCEQSTSNDLGNNIADLSFLSSVNQTSIDNLKALTNIQNPSTNFLSGITLPKNSYTDTVSVHSIPLW